MYDLSYFRTAKAGEATGQLGTTGAFRAFLDDYPDMRGPWSHHDLDALRMLRTELAAVFAAAAERDARVRAQRPFLRPLSMASPAELW